VWLCKKKIKRSKSFLDTPDEDTISTILEINKVISNAPKSENSIHACERSLESVAKCFHVDSILDISTSNWKLFRYEHLSKKLSVVLEGPAGSSDQYFEWIQKQLNYDGVILDEKDGFILALLPNRSYGPETQALTMNNSFDKIILTGSKNKGSSLLQLQKQEGRYAIFQVVIAKTENGLFTPGTKIILEKGKKKTTVPVDPVTVKQEPKASDTKTPAAPPNKPKSK
jgi:hypothetical protein